jgi:hypothetical protein
MDEILTSKYDINPSITNATPNIGQLDKNWISYTNSLQSATLYNRYITHYANWQRDNTNSLEQKLLQYGQYLYNVENDKGEKTYKPSTIKRRSSVVVN